MSGPSDDKSKAIARQKIRRLIGKIQAIGSARIGYSEDEGQALVKTRVRPECGPVSVPIQEQIQGPVGPDLCCREDQSQGTRPESGSSENQLGPSRTRVRPQQVKESGWREDQSQVVVRTRFMSQ